MRAPHFTLASASILSVMISPAFIASPRLRSLPPEMWIIAPFAPSKSTSRSRFFTTASAALVTLSVPFPSPTAMNPTPPPCMIARTSAKSMLMREGCVIVHTSPLIALARISSATANASDIGRLGTSCTSLLLSRIITESQFCLSFAIDSSAFFLLARSRANG